MSVKNTHKVIYSAATVELAHMLVNVLREHGIYSYVSNESLQFACGNLPLGVPTAPRVVVHEADSQEARAIALDFDRTVRNLSADESSEATRERRPFQFGLGTIFFILTIASIYFAVDRATKGTPIKGLLPGLAVWAFFWVTWYLVLRHKRIESDKREGPSTEELRELEEEVDDHAAEWPACPHCQRPRHTSCPVCETAGTTFPSAFMPDDEHDSGFVTVGDREKLFVVCPICDEVFAPQFLARCEWCGHRFRDGQEMPAAPPLATSLEINSRAWIVLVGLVALVGAVLALFAYIAPKS